MPSKTVTILLEQGDLSGVVQLRDSAWNAGMLHSAPRDAVKKLIEGGACKKAGVYLLLSNDKVYVGQSTDLAKRIGQHLSGKDWWTRVVILTTSDDSFTHSDIDYLESGLIEKASKLHRLDCTNQTKGNKPKVDQFQKPVLDQYLEEGLLMLQVIGNDVFTPSKPLDDHSALKAGKRQKGKAVEFLSSKGIKLQNSPTYAILQGSPEHFWANPRFSLLTEDWNIILNDTEAEELVVLKVPAGTFSPNDGFHARVDKPYYIDLKLSRETLTDMGSGINFDGFVVARVRY